MVNCGTAPVAKPFHMQTQLRGAWVARGLESWVLATRVHESLAWSSVLVLLSSDTSQTFLLSLTHSPCALLHSLVDPARLQVPFVHLHSLRLSLLPPPPVLPSIPACWHVLALTCSCSYSPTFTRETRRTFIIRVNVGSTFRCCRALCFDIVYCHCRPHYTFVHAMPSTPYNAYIVATRPFVTLLLQTFRQYSLLFHRFTTYIGSRYHRGQTLTSNSATHIHSHRDLF